MLFQCLCGLEPVCHFTQADDEPYNMELREITRFYGQVRVAVYNSVQDNNKFDFSFPDGKAREFILMCIVPVIIGLKMIDINLYHDFITGKNGAPMIEIFNTTEFVNWIVLLFLSDNETINDEVGKIRVVPEEKLMEIYDALFVNDYSGRNYEKIIGQYEFSASSKELALSVSSMMSRYADYGVENI